MTLQRLIDKARDSGRKYVTMNITVYLGANEGNDPSSQKAVTELGSWIGKKW